MTDPNLCATLALSGLAGLAMLVGGALAGWRGWLQLRARELDAGRGPGGRSGNGGSVAEPAGAGARIEIADLRERVRRLEAIAAGVEL